MAVSANAIGCSTVDPVRRVLIERRRKSETVDIEAIFVDSVIPLVEWLKRERNTLAIWKAFVK